MRITCPNCGAQYEIADDLIPEEGRELQCSNCGHIWFERPERPEAEDDADAPVAEAPEAEDEQDELPGQPRALPEDVSDILREEAETNRALREAPQDLDDDADAVAARIMPRRVDHTAGSAQKGRLPDADAITSTLHADPAEAAPAPGAKRGGFRAGFLLMLVLALLAALIYAFAPQLAESLPDGMKEALGSYSEWVDMLRLRLHMAVQSIFPG